MKLKHSLGLCIVLLFALFATFTPAQPPRAVLNARQLGVAELEPADEDVTDPIDDDEGYVDEDDEEYEEEEEEADDEDAFVEDEDEEVYESILDIWPDYPTQDEDFFFNEEEY